MASIDRETTEAGQIWNGACHACRYRIIPLRFIALQRVILLDIFLEYFFFLTRKIDGNFDQEFLLYSSFSVLSIGKCEFDCIFFRNRFLNRIN